MNLEPITRILLFIVVHMATGVDLEATFPTSSNVSFESEAKAYQVHGVSGHKVAMPCSSSQWSKESVALVLWYKENSEIPIYTLDVRDVPLTLSKHISSNELQARAYFDLSLQPPHLVIENLTKNDEGGFRCRVDYKAARTENFFLNLTITVPPKQTIIMDSEGQRLEGVIGPYEEGTDLVLICEAEGGDPQPTVKWWRAGRLIDESFTVGSHGLVRNELQLRTLGRSDLLAVLTCQSSNTELVLPSQASVSLDMTLKPLLVSIEPSGRFVSANSPTELSCRSVGSRPAASITWWIGSSQVKTMAIRQSVSKDGNVTLSTLSLVASPRDNEKVLTCRTEHSSLKDRALEERITLNVHYAPMVRIRLGAQIDPDAIREGNDVYVECIVDANPWVTEISWLFGGKMLYSDQSSGIIISNQSLVLQRVKRENRGHYTCMAVNSEGRGQSGHFHLRVHYAPICRSGQKVTYGVSRSEVVKVSCLVDADPANVSFKWHLNDLDIRTEMSTSTVTVNGTHSVATYIPSSVRTFAKLFCTATNIIGQQSSPCVFNIIPASVPEAVFNCSTKNQTFSSVLVHCQAGSDGGLKQSFHIEVYNETHTLLANITSPDMAHFSIDSLPLGDKFVFHIYARNSRGKSLVVFLTLPSLSVSQKQIHSQNEPIIIPLAAVVLSLIFLGLIFTTAILIICVKRKMRQSSSRQQDQASASGCQQQRQYESGNNVQRVEELCTLQPCNELGGKHNFEMSQKVVGDNAYAEDTIGNGYTSLYDTSGQTSYTHHVHVPYKYTHIGMQYTATTGTTSTIPCTAICNSELTSLTEFTAVDGMKGFQVNTLIPGFQHHSDPRVQIIPAYKTASQEEMAAELH